MLKVCGHRLLVKQDELEEVDTFYAAAKKAGFALPDHRDITLERKAIDTGTVVDIGRNAWAAFDDGHRWCEVGNRVAWVRHGGYIVKDPATKEEFICLNDEDILAVIG